MTPDFQRVLTHYIDGGWADANRSSDDDKFERGRPRSAYLLLTSCGMVIQPRSEVQVTTRCYRPFRAHKMVVAEDSARFDLTDLKVGFRSQLTQALPIPLRGCAGHVRGHREEVQPTPICWPLEVCAYGAEVSARAIIAAGREEDPGAEFEIVLLGEAVF